MAKAQLDSKVASPANKPADASQVHARRAEADVAIHAACHTLERELRARIAGGLPDDKPAHAAAEAKAAIDQRDYSGAMVAAALAGIRNFKVGA